MSSSEVRDVTQSLHLDIPLTPPPPNRPNLPHHASYTLSGAKRHSSFDTPREAPFPPGGSAEYPFPIVANDPLSTSTSTSESEGSTPVERGAGDSTNSLPLPKRTPVDQLPASLRENATEAAAAKKEVVENGTTKPATLSVPTSTSPTTDRTPTQPSLVTPSSQNHSRTDPPPPSSPQRTRRPRPDTHPHPAFDPSTFNYTTDPETLRASFWKNVSSPPLTVLSPPRYSLPPPPPPSHPPPPPTKKSISMPVPPRISPPPSTPSISSSSSASSPLPHSRFLAHQGAPPPPSSTVGQHISVETRSGEYIIHVGLEGVRREGITLSTRRKRTLHIAADSYDAALGGHFERRITFGDDAELGPGKVRAEFDGVALRVVVARRTF